MANRLRVADINAIKALLERGWAHRKIARELGLHRGTVGGYARRWQEESESKPAKVTPGSGEAAVWSKPARVTPGSDPKPAKVTPGSDPKPAKVTPGSPGGQSLCEPYSETIIEKLEIGLSAQRIYQNLTIETDFPE